MGELKPCPLCQGQAKHEHRAPGGTMSSGMEPHMQRVACTKCGIRFEWEHPKFEWDSQDKHDAKLRASLVERWNTRPAPSEAEVEAAARMILAADRRDVGRVDSYWDWLMPVERENYLRMARAALGVPDA